MKIAMIFPGYASQFVGMGKELYDESRIMQEYFEQASHCLDINFVKLCFASSDVELSKMSHAYTSLFLVTSAIAALLKDTGIKPDVVAGYGVGQYAAMHTAQGLTFADGLYLLNKLAFFCQELFDTQHVSVIRIKGCSQQELQDVIVRVGSESLHVAYIELPNQYIVSGDKDAVQTCMRYALEIKKVKVEELSLGYGMHSPYMTSVIKQFEVYFEKVDFKDIEIPLISNSGAQPIFAGSLLKQETLDYETKTVVWLQVMQALYDIDLMLLIGPSNQLNDMFKQIYPQKQIVMIQKPADITYLQEYISQHAI